MTGPTAPATPGDGIGTDAGRARLVTPADGAPLAHLWWPAAARPSGRSPAGRATPSAPPLAVLLHGIGGGRGGWGAVAAALADDGWRVAAVDLPGYGASPSVSPLDLAAMAGAVNALIAWLDAEAALVVGHSMGGMVAQELAATTPRTVGALVLAATSPAFGRSDGAWQRGFVASRCAPLDAGRGMAALAAELVPTMAGPGADAARVAAAVASMAAVPEATYRAALAALLPFDRRAELAAIAVPTLVVTGMHDRTAPPELASRMAARIPGALLRLVPDCGHLAMLEQPAAFADAVRGFARGVAAAAVANRPLEEPPR